MFSMMRFSGAATMFGMEQIQNAMAAPADTQAALVRLCNTLDSMSEALAAKLDSSKKSALDSMSKAQMDILDSTSNAVNLDAVNLDTATDFMKKTSESLAGMMNRSPNGKAAAGAV
jgi:hypothetical protein